MPRSFRACALAVIASFCSMDFAQAQGFTPHVSGEADLGLYSVSTYKSQDPARRGTSLFLFGEVATGFHIAPGLSLQTVVAFEPIGEGDALGGFPMDGVIGFRRQSAFLEVFFAEWKPDEALTLYGGRFVAPFSRGHHDFPGILARVRAHEVQMIGDVMGVGGAWNFLADPRFGEHDISAAAFTLDRSFLSSTWLTRRRCCDERYERYNRNTEQQGGPSNNGQMDNFALSLDGDKFDFAPGLSYQLSLVSRAAGKEDGTAREWGYSGALRYEQRWSAAHRTLFFAEAVQFRNAEGRPQFETDDGVETTIAERRNFSTLGAQHRIDDWRGTLVWQRDQRKRSVDSLPTENYLEASIGRDIGGGFGLDLGYQYARQLMEDTNQLGTSHAVLARLSWRGGT